MKPWLKLVLAAVFVSLGTGVFICHAAPVQQPLGEVELIYNPQLYDLNGWEVHDSFNPTTRGNEVMETSYGIRFYSRSGNDSMGIMQKLNVDVSRCSSLVLSAKVMVDQQTLSGTGWQGREAPVYVFVTYTDVYGVLHNELNVYPNENQSRRMFWHGFYYLRPTGNSSDTFGTQVSQEYQEDYAVDLLTSLFPRPRVIHYVGAGGSGWAVRDGTIFMLSLKSR